MNPTPRVTVADETSIAAAVELLRAGRLVAFPTETVYGLGAVATDAAAVARIYEAKGRPPTNPVIVHVASVAAARELVSAWPAEAEKLAAEFWPGPLTLVLPRREVVPQIVTAGGATVGLRIPAHPVALALLEQLGLPLAAPSANRSNEISPTTAEHVRSSLGERVSLVLDGGETAVGLESTVLQLGPDGARILRPGMITAEQIEAVLHVPVLAGPTQSGGTLASPGMLERHYSPRAALEVHAESATRVRELLAAGARVGWMPLADGVELPAARDNVTIVPMPSEAAEYARVLYAVLHSLDATGATHIVVERPPSDGGWVAIQDRLRRASAR